MPSWSQHQNHHSNKVSLTKSLYINFLVDKSTFGVDHDNITKKNHGMTNKTSKRLTLKKIEIIEYKKWNKDTSNRRIAEIFSIKFNKKIDRRTIKKYVDNEQKITDSFIKTQNIDQH
ncbi:hypothetical protein DMUE_0971 [Dictyocoela muelleri]|nr:hypothetical protein DMUE_0971 [Dictyocoela muelleri]